MQVYDYRTQFSKWWQSEHKAVTFPLEVQSRLPCPMQADAEFVALEH
jgi:hypothetical protein